MQLRIDDMSDAGSYRGLMESLKPALEVRYEVSIKVMTAQLIPSLSLTASRFA